MPAFTENFETQTLRRKKGKPYWKRLIVAETSILGIMPYHKYVLINYREENKVC